MKQEEETSNKILGIISYGAYIPIYRMKHELLGQVWGDSSQTGTEKAVANEDEDSITMAVEAAIDCLRGIERNSVDALFFASTTAPYIEKQSASIIAAACDLRREILAVDITNSTRSGTIALKLAADAVHSGSAQKALIVASDCRVPPPNSELETLFGDGAAALLIGEQDVVAELQGNTNLTSEFTDIWRLPEDGQFRVWEDRFILNEGYAKHIRKTIELLIKQSNLTSENLAKVAFYAPNQRAHTSMARAMRLDSTQIQNPLFNKVGNTGTAFALMTFVGALEDAKPGDKILLANYGDGADAYLFQINKKIEKEKTNHRGIKKHLDSKLMLANYGKYVTFRHLMQFQPAFEFKWRSSLTVTWRDRDQIYRFYGHKCRRCGSIQYPQQRLCMYCQARGNFEEVRLSDKKGQLVTFSIDERAPVNDPPSVLAALNLEGGGRLFCTMTDRDVNDINIGMPMELTFRKIHDALGFHNYFWKCRPER